jgi:hypothetical protein
MESQRKDLISEAALFGLAREFRKVLEETVQKFESDKNWTPDLVTSWS